MPDMIGCRVFGHRYRFWSQDRTMRWACQRGCGAGGTKQYGTAAQARRYASAFDREDTESLGRRAPLVGLLPLRLGRAVLDRQQRQQREQAKQGRQGQQRQQGQRRGG